MSTNLTWKHVCLWDEHWVPDDHALVVGSSSLGDGGDAMLMRDFGHPANPVLELHTNEFGFAL